MSKRRSRLIALVMFLAGDVFVYYALRHPELGWPGGNQFAYAIYSVYLLLMMFFLVAPFKRRK